MSGCAGSASFHVPAKLGLSCAPAVTANATTATRIDTIERMRFIGL
jgi:hypothetical protein